MKVVVAHEAMSAALAVAARCLGAESSTLDAIKSFLLEAEADVLFVTATNLELAVRVPVHSGVAVSESGVCLAQGGLLRAFFQNTAGGTVTLDADAEHVLRLQHGRTKATIRNLTPDDYPIIPFGVASHGRTVSLGELRDSIERLKAHASANRKQLALSGFWLHDSEDGVLTLVTTDATRMAVKWLGSALPSDERLNVVVPAGLLHELAKVKGEGEVVLGLAEKGRLAVSLPDGTQYLSQLVQERFPNVLRALPSERGAELSVALDDLRRAVRVARAFADGDNHRTVLQWDPGDAIGGTLRVVCQQHEGLAGNTSEVDCTVAEPGSVAVNGKSLGDAIDSLDAATMLRIYPQTSGPTGMQPVLLVGDADESLQIVIMPLVLAG